jgi:hypothetical protein
MRKGTFRTDYKSRATFPLNKILLGAKYDLVVSRWYWYMLDKIFDIQVTPPLLGRDAAGDEQDSAKSASTQRRTKFLELVGM